MGFHSLRFQCILGLAKTLEGQQNILIFDARAVFKYYWQAQWLYTLIHIQLFQLFSMNTTNFFTLNLF